MLHPSREVPVDEREEAWQDLRRRQKWLFVAAFAHGLVLSAVFLLTVIAEGPDYFGGRLLGPQVAAALYGCWPAVLFPAAAWWQNRRTSAIVLPDGTIECRRHGRPHDMPPGAVITRFSSVFPGPGLARVDTGHAKARRVNMLARHAALRVERVPQAGSDGLGHRWVRRADGSQALLTDRWRVGRAPFRGLASVYEPLGKGRRSNETMLTPTQLIQLYEGAQLAAGESQPVGRLVSSLVGLVALMLGMFLGLLAMSSWAVGRTSSSSWAPAGARIPSDVPGEFDHFHRMVLLGRYGSLGGLGVLALGLALATRTGESSPEGFTVGRRLLRRTRVYPWRGATLEIRIAGWSDRADHRLRTPSGRVVVLPLRRGETGIVLRHARLGGARIEYNGDTVPPPPWLVEAGAPEVPPPSAAAAMTLDAPAPASTPSSAGDPPPTLA